MKCVAEISRLLLTVSLLLAGVAASAADTTLQEVLKDNNVDPFWTYDSLETAVAQAESTGKPLLVTIRCVPCKACLGMDTRVVNPTDEELRDLMGKFVCVRIVQAWGLDLSLFQYDMNMSWAAFLLNADGVIYGRYGTRAAQRDDSAITVPGFKKALAEALEWHGRYEEDPESVAGTFAGKKGPAPRWSKPEVIPAIPKTVRWDKQLGRMTAQQTHSCVHCHFVPAAEMMGLMKVSEPITDRHLWAYPLPETVGLELDPEEKATVTAVAPESPAAAAGVRAGDRIRLMNGQPILSIADVQWVLHRAENRDQLPLRIERSSGEEEETEMFLPRGWRRQGEFVDRASSWDLFKVKLFGVAQMRALDGEERRQAGVGEEGMALRVEKLSPAWAGMNKDAREAGLKEGDVVVKVDAREDIRTHSELLAYLVQERASGGMLELAVLREGKRVGLEVPLQWNERIDALRAP